MVPFPRAVAALIAAFLASTAVQPASAQDTTPTPAAPASEALAAAAEPARSPDEVIANVGDATITEREIAIARDAFASELANIPPEQQRAVLTEAVVNMKLMALGAEKDGLGNGPDFDAQLAFLRLQALRNAYVENSIAKSITPEELDKAYQELVVGQFQPEEQIRARHILVDTKEAAQKVIDDFKGGASFEELAKQSKDPSGQNGGDLGFFGKGQMVPEFETAAFALAAGEVTPEPVQSQFGWHVIKVEEKRMSQPPALTEVEPQLRQYMMRQKFEEALTALRAAYPVDILDPTAQPPAAPAPAAPAPEGATPETTPTPAQ